MNLYSDPGSRPRTLYISDMDGTLLNAESRLSSESVGILNALQKAGVLFTVATARTPATVQPLLQDVRVSSYPAADGSLRSLPAIVLTGGALWDRSLCRYSSIHLIPREDAALILRHFSDSGIEPFVYCLSGDDFLNVYHSADLNRREDAFYQERRHLRLKRFHLGQAPASLSEVVIFFAMGDVDRVQALTARLQGLTDCSVSWYRDIFSSDTGLIDIYGPGVSKANAVLQLKELVRADRVVVFGDNLNDLPMMKVADLSVAVANALPEVRAQADVVIGSNLHDSVPRFVAEAEGIVL